MPPIARDPAAHCLVVMRHAKAEDSGPSDAERALAERGHRQAQATGRWLAEQGVVPDAALVSSARRTQETWRSLCDGAGFDAAVAAIEPGLYSAGPDSALDLVRLVDEDVTTLLVVGHNPTMEMVAMMLDDGAGELDPSAGYPTAALTVFELSGRWADLGHQGARALAWHAERG